MTIQEFGGFNKSFKKIVKLVSKYERRDQAKLLKLVLVTFGLDEQRIDVQELINSLLSDRK